PVWSDEFDGPAGRGVDGAKWQADSTDGCQQGNCGWGNQEKEYYSTAAENVALDGSGHLMIAARPARPGLRCYYGPCRYTSGKITTRGKFDTSHGRVEARIKLPAGQGLWPAFWILGADILTTGWPACGELDIMESHGSRPSTTSSAIHGPGYFGQTPFVHSRTLPHGSYADDFHIFAVEWDSLRVQFFVDDFLHYTVERRAVERFGKWVFDKQFFVILNLAVGGTFDGDPRSDSVLPATMVVDYVRVYRAAAR
ncbi:MAG TPA: glycoside hydrolase family 16 protein, partial [Gemmatimonadaceae bacterium]|nr:glycoside hydrolase family 16 protein [Gemmatimonadaceae bacterium]